MKSFYINGIILAQKIRHLKLLKKLLLLMWHCLDEGASCNFLSKVKVKRKKSINLTEVIVAWLGISKLVLQTFWFVDQFEN